MGIEDRDYYRERQRSFLDDDGGSGGGFMVIAFWITVCLVGAALLWESPWASGTLSELRDRIRPLAPQLDSTSPRPVESGPAQSRAASPAPSTTRCLINGEWFIAESGKCPSTSEPAAQPLTRSAPLPQPSAARADPFITPGTIYLCRTYSDGRYWSNAHCRRDNALIERIVSVPATLPFEQQVALGQAAEREGARLMSGNQPVGQPHIRQQTSPSTASECSALAARINTLDALARQPQSAQNQDRIRGERNNVRSRQLGLGCR